MMLQYGRKAWSRCLTKLQTFAEGRTRSVLRAARDAAEGCTYGDYYRYWRTYAQKQLEEYHYRNIH